MTDPSDRRPGTVSAAGSIGVVAGTIGSLLYMLTALGAFFAGVPFAGLVGLGLTAVLLVFLVGGLHTVQGRSPRLLLRASYAVMALGLIALVLALLSSASSPLFGLVGMLLPGAVVVLLLRPATRQYYEARGISY